MSTLNVVLLIQYYYKKIILKKIESTFDTGKSEFAIFVHSAVLQFQKL